VASSCRLGHKNSSTFRRIDEWSGFTMTADTQAALATVDASWEDMAPAVSAFIADTA
jgi:hypothetical protein